MQIKVDTTVPNRTMLVVDDIVYRSYTWPDVDIATDPENAMQVLVEAAFALGQLMQAKKIKADVDSFCPAAVVERKIAILNASQEGIV